jgi:hypothetical protein
MREATICQVMSCNRPSDGWYVCKLCADILAETLTDMAWMLDELDIVITQQTRYTTQSSGRSAESPLVFNIKAADTKANLVNELDTVARVIAGANGWQRTYTTPKGCAVWLEQKISAIRLHPAGGEMTNDISSWYGACLWVIDRPAQRQYLGDHADMGTVVEVELNTRGTSDEQCPGRIYGRAGKPEARCDTCGATFTAEKLRERLLHQLDDKLCSAAEIAHLSTYLGLDIGREQVRKRINQWHKREQIQRKGGTDVDPKFRFGDALGLLARHDSTPRSA